MVPPGLIMMLAVLRSLDRVRTKALQCGNYGGPDCHSTVLETLRQGKPMSIVGSRLTITNTDWLRPETLRDGHSAIMDGARRGPVEVVSTSVVPGGAGA